MLRGQRTDRGHIALEQALPGQAAVAQRLEVLVGLPHFVQAVRVDGRVVQREDAVFLVGSDGVFGRMCEQEILDVMKKHIDNGREKFALQRLFLRARRDKNDDQTAVLLCVR